MAQATEDSPDESNPKAVKFQAEAEKKASKFDWFGANKEKNQEDACELFLKAGAQWKITKHFEKAGNCYKRAAECSTAAGNVMEANNHWKEAGKCYRHVSSALAIGAYNHPITYYKENDKFNQAAKLIEEIGDMLYEDKKLEEAMEQYEIAADLYEGENDQTNANKRWVIVADICAQLKKYDRAVELYEKTARFNMDNNLLRWNAKTFLFKALLCQINNCVDRDDPKVWYQLPSILDKYRDLNDLFAQSREYQLCAGLVDSVPRVDLTAFDNATSAYNKIVKFDAWGIEQIAPLREYIVAKQQAPPKLNEDIDVGASNLGKTEATETKALEEQKDDIDLSAAPDIMSEDK